MIKTSELTPLQKKLAMALAGTLLFYVLFGFLGAPFIVRHVLEKKVAAAIDREIKVATIRVNPVTLSLTLKELDIQNDKNKRFIGADRLYVNLQAWSIFKGGLLLKNVEMEGLFADIQQYKDGSFNFSDITNSKKTDTKDNAKEKEPFYFAILKTRIAHANLNFSDRIRSVDHKIENLNITLTDLTAFPKESDVYTLFELNGTVNAAKIALKGKTRPFHETLFAGADLDVKGFSLPHYLPYIPLPENMTLVSAAVDTATQIKFTKKAGDAGSLVISGNTRLFKIRIDNKKNEPVFTFPEINIETAPSDLMATQVHLAGLSLVSPDISLRRMSSGQFDLPGMAASENRAQNPSPVVEKAEKQTPAVSIDLVEISNGNLHFSDQSNSREFSTRISGMKFSLKNFAIHDDRKADLEFSAQTDAGETLSVNGSLTALPVNLDMRLDLQNLNAPHYTPYYQDTMDFRIVKGTVAVGAGLKMALNGDTPAISFENMDIEVNHFNAIEPDLKTPVIAFEKLGVKGILDLTKKTVNLDAVSLTNGSLDIRRDKDGKTNLEKAFIPKAGDLKEKADTPQPPAAEDKNWQFTITSARVDQFSVKAKDLALDDPFESAVEDLNISAENISNLVDEKGKVNLSFKCNKSGRISSSGDMTVNPLSANLDLSVKQLGINPVQPYLSGTTGLIIKDGYFNTDGKLKFSMSEEKGPAMGYKGKMSLNRFSSIDRAKADDFLKWDSLYLTGMDLTSNPVKARIENVSLSDFYARVVIDKDGTVNLATVLGGDEKTKAQPVADDTKTASKKQTDAPKKPASSSKLITIDRVTLQGGEIKLTDRLIPQGFDADIIDIGGSISGLASIKEKKADLFLKGRLDNHAPVEISGKINPLIDNMFADIKLIFSDIELSPFSPYSGQYVGYVLEKGKLTFDLAYLLQDKALLGTNKLYINQLTFGDTVDSPDAVNLPIKLAIALLKDREGNIELDLPVKGRLDDPEFKIGKVVLTVLKNLIVKIVSSPFAALGAMIGGGEELSYLDFDPAVSDLREDGREKLEKLVTILYERPNLNLEIKGGFDPEKDREKMRSIQYENLLKAEKLKTLLKDRGTDMSLDDIVIEAAERETWIPAAYEAAAFPKPRDETGKIKELTIQEMDKLLLTSIQVTDDMLRILAHKRAQTAKDYILESKKAAPERIFIIEPDMAGDNEKEGPKSRVVFSLK